MVLCVSRVLLNHTESVLRGKRRKEKLDSFYGKCVWRVSRGAYHNFPTYAGVCDGSKFSWRKVFLRVGLLKAHAYRKAADASLL